MRSRIQKSRRRFRNLFIFLFVHIQFAARAKLRLVDAQRNSNSLQVSLSISGGRAETRRRMGPCCSSPTHTAERGCSISTRAKLHICATAASKTSTPRRHLHEEGEQQQSLLQVHVVLPSPPSSPPQLPLATADDRSFPLDVHSALTPTSSGRREQRINVQALRFRASASSREDGDSSNSSCGFWALRHVLSPTSLLRGSADNSYEFGSPYVDANLSLDQERQRLQQPPPPPQQREIWQNAAAMLESGQTDDFTLNFFDNDIDVADDDRNSDESTVPHLLPTLTNQC